LKLEARIPSAKQINTTGIETSLKSSKNNPKNGQDVPVRSKPESQVFY
jgi:hypothetical protein